MGAPSNSDAVGTSGSNVVMASVLNLANSVIGVSVLAMAYCFKECGLVLGTILMLLTAFFARQSSVLLLGSLRFAKKRTYEALGLCSFGEQGKLAVELSLIGLLVGSLIASLTVVGDVVAPIVAEWMDMPVAYVRTPALALISALVAFPLSLRRNIQSLSNISAMSLVFYAILACVMVYLAARRHLFGGDSAVQDVAGAQLVLFNLNGVLPCIPILGFGFVCQCTIFVVYDELPQPNLPLMYGIVNKAVATVASVYFVTGFFGYLAFSAQHIDGDILNNLDRSIGFDLVKLGFAISVVTTLPLSVYPLRESVDSLVFRPASSQNAATVDPVLDITAPIPDGRFFAITLFLVGFCTIMAIVAPRIEFILGLTGATMGISVAYTFPALVYMKLTPQGGMRQTARLLLFIGIVFTVLCTAAVFMTPESHAETAAAIPESPVAHSFDPRDILPVDTVPVRAVTGRRIDAVFDPIENFLKRHKNATAH